MQVIERTPAKVNLCLLVGPQLEGGSHHELFTIFAPIDLYDTLDFDLEVEAGRSRAGEIDGGVQSGPRRGQPGHSGAAGAGSRDRLGLRRQGDHPQDHPGRSGSGRRQQRRGCRPQSRSAHARRGRRTGARRGAGGNDRAGTRRRRALLSERPLRRSVEASARSCRRSSFPSYPW